MTDREIQQAQEIEKLQKKVEELSEAYHLSLQELDELRRQNKPRPKGRPGIPPEKREKILVLFEQGKSMRQIAGEVNVSVATVHNVVKSDFYQA